MTQLFHPATNTFSRFSIFGALFLLAALGWIISIIYRSPYATGVNVARDQPVQFSHAHHVGAIGIDCRYCHTSVEDSSFASIPATSICIGCHSIIYRDSPMLAPVHESYRTRQPLRWTRVHDVPDFVYFDHSIHVAKGVGCVTCHGKVNEMPLMWKDQTLHMQWCLDCHRKPEEFLRDRSTVFDMNLVKAQSTAGGEKHHAEDHGSHGSGTEHEAPSQQAAQDAKALDGKQLVDKYHVLTKQLSDCSICHR